MRIVKLFLLLFIFINTWSQSVTSTDYTYTYGEALKNKLLGNYPLSIAFFTECIKINPSSAASYYQLSLIYNKSKYSNLTLHYAKQAVDFDNSNIWYLNNLINQFVESNKYDSALLYINNNIQKFGSNKELMLKKIVILFELKNYNKALKEIKVFEKKFFAIEETELIKFRCYVQKGKLNNASKVINDLISLNPDEIKYLGILAELYSESKKVNESLVLYNKMLLLDSCKTESILSFFEFSKNLKSDSLITKSINLILNCQTIDPDYKLQFISSLIKESILRPSQLSYCYKWLNANDSILNSNLSYLALMTDNALYEQNYEQAQLFLCKLVNIKPDNVFFREQYIFLLSYLNRYSDVISQIDSASIYYKVPTSLTVLKGISNYQLGNFTSCLSLLEPFISDSSLKKEDKLKVYTYFGECLYRLNKKDSAYIYFDKVLSIDTANTYILNNYSYYLSIDSKNLNKAKDMSFRTLLVEPNSPTYLDTYSWILYKMKLYAEALIYIKKAFQNGGENNSEIIEHYAMILFCNKKFDEAKSMIQTLNKNSIPFNELNCE